VRQRDLPARRRAKRASSPRKDITVPTLRTLAAAGIVAATLGVAGAIVETTGKAFKFPMATVAIWKRGKIVEEHLFWDNLTFLKQVGLAT
jgi:ketosteroid isomerase-like protein